ncbi:MAG: carboxyl transferase domain-containing protein [Solirubrobacterales bacterium]
MAILKTRIDTGSALYAENREQMLGRLEKLADEQAKARLGGGEQKIARHHDRGRMLPRERIEMLLDRDSPFLELAPLAAYGSEYEPGASLVAGIGVVEGIECLLTASDPTVRGGTSNPYTLRKSQRMQEIARVNRLPAVGFVESGGADLPRQKEIFVPGGATFRNLTQASAAGVPTVALVTGNSTAGGAYLPGMSDYVVMVREQGLIFLGGPPLVKMATGEEAEEEALGGAEMHSRVSGVSEFMANDEVDLCRIGREIVRNLNWRKLGPAPRGSGEEPLCDPEELLGIASHDLRIPFDAREVIARIVDGSRFDEFKPGYGTQLVTGWAELHGYPVAILANNGVLFNEDAEKAAHFIQLADQVDTPLLFLQNTSGYIVGTDYEQRGIVKAGAKMINAVANTGVPKLTLMMGGSYGAGNYGMCGRSFEPRFIFAWPNYKTAVMGPKQLAGVMEIVARGKAARTGTEVDEEQLAAVTKAVEDQIEAESDAFISSGELWDDGMIDPRDTRTALGIALSASHGNEVAGSRRFGVFRM